MAELQVIITGENQSGAAFAELRKDAGDVKEGLEGAKSSGTGFFGGMLQAASGFLAANVLGNIAGQLTSFVGDGITAAQDTAKLMAQTENIIKNTGGAAGVSAQQVADLATSLSDAAGKSLFGDDQIQGAENVLLKYKELKGIIPGVTQLSVDMAASLGKDPAAAAEFLGRALQKPFDAASKLAKEGIVLSDSQKATLAAFEKTGDAAGAQKFLMDQLNGTYAGSAEAQAKAAGGMVQFKARMGEVGETIGAALLPALNTIGSMLADNVAPAIEVAAAWLGDKLPKAIAIATSFWTSTLQPALAKVWAFLSAALIPIFTELTNFLNNELPPAIAQVADYWNNTLQPALDRVWAFIQENVIPIINVLVKVAFAILKEDIKILAGIWVNILWPALQKVWAFIDKNVIPILAQLIVWVKDNLPPAIKFLADLWNNTLLPALSAVWAFIDSKVLPILKAVGDVVSAVLVVAFKLIGSTLSNVVIPAFEKMWAYLDKNIIPIFKSVGEFIYNNAGPAFAYLADMISPVVDFMAGLLDNIQGVVGWLETLAKKISSIKIPEWAGGSGGGSSSSGGGGGGGSFRASAGFTTSAARSIATQGGISGGQAINVNVSFDGRGSDLLRQMIRVEVENIMSQSGNKSFNRMRTGG